MTASRVEAVFDVEASRALDERQREALIWRAGPTITAVAQDTRGAGAQPRTCPAAAGGEDRRRPGDCRCGAGRPGRPAPRASAGSKRSGGRANASARAAALAATTDDGQAQEEAGAEAKGEDGRLRRRRGQRAQFARVAQRRDDRQARRGPATAATSQEDAWHRRSELLFERLAVRWEIAGLPLDDQKMLLGRYRMADTATQQWVRETIATHIERHIPELAG